MHDKSKAQLEAVVQFCTKIRDNFDKLSSQCGCSSTDVECELAKFLEVFFERRLDAIDYILQFWGQCYRLVNVADDKRCENTDSCCDSRIIADTIIAVAPEVEQDIRDLLDICQQLYDLARRIHCELHPSCKRSNDKVSKEKLAKIKAFIVKFGEILPNAESILSEIGKVCDKLSKLIVDAQRKL